MALKINSALIAEYIGWKATPLGCGGRAVAAFADFLMSDSPLWGE
jgi:hypothetical protein